MSKPNSPKTEVAVSASGYGNPPKETRFKKGQSGNPRGRPRRNPKPSLDPLLDNYIGDIVLMEALRPVTVRENDRRMEMPMIQAVIRSLGVSAMKGSHRSQLAITDLVMRYQEKNLDARGAIYTAVQEYKQHYREVFERCDREGLPRPEPVPHPDEIVVDERTLGIRYNGPESHDQKAHWDEMLRRKAGFKLELEELRKELHEDPEHASMYEEEIAYTEYIYRLLDQTFPEIEERRKPGFDIEKWRKRKRDKPLKRPTLRRTSG